MATKAGVEQQIETIMAEITRIKLENSVYQKFIEKKTLELGMDDDGKKKKKNKTKNAPALLTPDQKYDIANTVNEDLQQEIEIHKKNSEKMIDTLRAVLEETEIRIGELKRDAYEFKRDVVAGSENSKNGKIIAERVTRYFDEKFKQIEALIGKLKLKNSTLRSAITKIERQLAQKEEIGKTIQALNDYKRKLTQKLEESEWLKNEVELKRLQLEKLVKEHERNKKITNHEKRQRNVLRIQVEEAAEMPNVQDYILQKKEMYELETSLKNWQRKVEIMTFAAKRARLMRLSSP